MRYVRCCLWAALLSPSFAAAQGVFWLVDFENQFIGEVAAVDPAHVWVAIDAPDGEPVFVPFAAVGGDPASPEVILYETTDCDGPAYVESSYSRPAMRSGYWANEVEIFATMRQVREQISVQSEYHGDTFQCETVFPPELHIAREVEYLGVLDFTAPVRVIRNPDAQLLGLGPTSATPPGAPAPIWRTRIVARSKPGMEAGTGEAAESSGEKR